MQDRLYEMLLKKDEITWQSIIYDLIKTEQMNPWDIDVSLLTKKYIEAVKHLKEANFFLSGKILLASALLLRIKSDRLVSEDLANFDSFLFPSEDSHEELPADYDIDALYRDVQIPRLAIKTPQSRKRNVNVNDLIGALQRALEVNKRKVLREIEDKRHKHPVVPRKKVNIGDLIKDIYSRLLDIFKTKRQVTFADLVGSEGKEEKILTFIPLLHLDNQEKITLSQEEHFGDIYIEK